MRSFDNIEYNKSPFGDYRVGYSPNAVWRIYRIGRRYWVKTGGMGTAAAFHDFYASTLQEVSDALRIR